MPADPEPLRPLPAATLGPALLAWYDRARRPLPWRRDRNPYRIWVAEVILQQTRVAQAVPYYERFVDEFPTVRALADARLERVLKVWQGAGYYARARHLHAAARELVRDHGGELPRTVAELERLPGIGPYIARSIAALAFGTPTVALEANGVRVGARWILAEGDVRSARVRRTIEAALRAVLGELPPGPFNEAVMELGETVCHPTAPDCGLCPVADACRARHELPDPAAVPARRRGPRRPHVRGAVVVLEDSRGRWLVQRRPPKGLLGGLWEFPGGKLLRGESPPAAAARELLEETGGRARSLSPVGIVRHGYSHFTVELHVFRGRARTPLPATSPTRRWITPRGLRHLALPRATEKMLTILTAAPDRASRGSGSRRGRRRA